MISAKKAAGVAMLKKIKSNEQLNKVLGEIELASSNGEFRIETNAMTADTCLALDRLGYSREIIFEEGVFTNRVIVRW
jgi:hypothetical protein